MQLLSSQLLTYDSYSSESFGAPALANKFAKLVTALEMAFKDFLNGFDILIIAIVENGFKDYELMKRREEY